MIFSFILYLCALFADGATDAANSVTGAVASGEMKLKYALLSSSIATFTGCFGFSLFIPKVMENSTVITSQGTQNSLIILLSSLASVALWAFFAWFLGIPTSEGHALISAAFGGAIALGEKAELSNFFLAVAYIIPLILLCALLCALTYRLLEKAKLKAKVKGRLIKAMMLLSSLIHGAQDGQKFLALGLSLGLFQRESLILWSVITGGAMALGSAFGGKRIIMNMGKNTAPTTSLGAISADISSTVALSLFTVLGIPASTTHGKISALCISSFLSGKKPSSLSVISVLFAWFATFPVTVALSFLLSKLFFALFL